MVFLFILYGAVFSHVGVVVFLLTLVLLFFAHRCNCFSSFCIVAFYTHEFERTFEGMKL
jgi:5-bromo-4-chloroindolyl phosphate hydrolysis protein